MVAERKFVTEKIRRVLLKEYLMKATERAGFGGVDIQRTPMGTRVTLMTEKPGLVIGRKGSAIKELTRAVEDNFKFDNPQIEVEEVREPNLNAQIMAEKLASALERGWHFRRAGHSTVRRIMESGARGCQITIAGKLTGERHRTEKFRKGMIKYCGESALLFMDRGYTMAKLKPGAMGITVWIMRKDAKLPDEITVLGPKGAQPVPAPADSATAPAVEGAAVPVDGDAAVVAAPVPVEDAAQAKPAEQEQPAAGVKAAQTPTAEPETKEESK